MDEHLYIIISKGRIFENSTPKGEREGMEVKGRGVDVSQVAHD